MRKLTVNPEKCVACRTCELMCSFKHFGKFSPSLSSVKVIDNSKTLISAPAVCMQCDNADCLEACPTDAISVDGNGVVVIDLDSCIACHACVSACPYDAMKVSPADEKVFKCDLCGGDPQCVKYCNAGALEFTGKEASK
jgi:Fe-S-cluster-containing hydrogenase component 2